MFHIIVILKAKEVENVEYIEGLLKDISTITLNEESCCKKLDVYHSKTDEKIFVLCEQWERKVDWEAHRDKRAFKQIYLPKVLPLVERDPHISDLISGTI